MHTERERGIYIYIYTLDLLLNLKQTIAYIIPMCIYVQHIQLSKWVI